MLFTAIIDLNELLLQFAEQSKQAPDAQTITEYPYVAVYRPMEMNQLQALASGLHH